MAITPEIEQRIIAAADALYAEGNKEKFPTVDEVRKRAKTSMGDVSAVMRDWRRQQTAQAKTPDEDLPAELVSASESLAASIWKTAQGISRDALNAAQAAWEKERAESEQLQAEMAEAFESLKEEKEESENDLMNQLRKQGSELSEARDDSKRWEGEAGKSAAIVNELRSSLEKAERRAERAEERASQAANEAAELRGKVAGMQGKAAK